VAGRVLSSGRKSEVNECDAEQSSGIRLNGLLGFILQPNPQFCRFETKVLRLNGECKKMMKKPITLTETEYGPVSV
jgi:hypothetical protein